MRKHNGFTLVELVVVVMILGILAAVAAPKLLSTSSAATDNGIRQSLAVVRDAIERYAAENGGQLPGGATATEATFTAAIAPYLRGGVLPTCPVGGKDASVKVTAGTDPIAGETFVAGMKSWHYCSGSGQFICNLDGKTGSDETVYYDQL